MRIPWILAIWIAVGICSFAAVTPVAPGLEVTQEGPASDVRAFTWGESGELWVVSRSGKRFSLVRQGQGTAGARAEFSLPRLRAPVQELVYRGGVLYLTDGPLVRRFEVTGARLTALDPWTTPEAIPGTGSQAAGLDWGPDGFLHLGFSHPHSNLSGIARLNPRRGEWEILTTGTGGGGDLAFDRHGNLFTAGPAGVFQVAAGVTYGEGGAGGEAEKHPFVRVSAPLVPGDVRGVLVYDGDAWPAENKDTLVVVEASSRTLKQYRLTPEGATYHAGLWRDVVQFDRDDVPGKMSVGPDGAVWMRVDRSGQGTLLRIAEAGPRGPKRDADLARLPTAELVELLEHSNSWHRRTALQVLSQRNDLPNSRGLHPGTRLHVLLEKSPDPQSRLAALWAMHAMGFLEDDHLEATYLDPDPWVKAWSARLVGERRMPTAMAFKVMEKLGRSTNGMVRSAVTVAARQFVSGSLTRDTTPVIPIREVFIGGILSGLLFAAVTEDDPVLQQQYWNALRPITAFDPVHALGFFKGDQGSTSPLVSFLIRNIALQLVESADPRNFTEGIAAIGALDPKSVGHIRAALLGLREGLPRMKLRAGAAEAGSIRNFETVEDPEVKELVQAVLIGWGR